MTGTWASLAPALALLALLGLLAWGVQWMRRRTLPAGADGAALRVVSQLMVGPQQRVVVVELDGPHGAVQLTLGVTPQHVRTLHVQPLDVARRTTSSAKPATASPAYVEVARAVSSAPPSSPAAR